MNKIEFTNAKSFRIEQTVHTNEEAGTSVYIAIDNDLNRRVILKVMRFEDKEQKRIILEEISNQVALEQHSDFAPKIYNYFVDNKESKIIIEMQHVEGKSLRAILESRHNLRKDKVWYDKAYNLLLDIAKAVSYIHGLRGFVHKDLKPENIIVVSKRNSVYILDYGISGLALADKGTGTARYMAPEQISGANNNFVYQATDVYALGQIALELFGIEPVEYGVDVLPDRSGSSWLTFKDISSIGGGFYPGLFKVISKALSLNPKDRYMDSRAFYEALNRERKSGHGLDRISYRENQRATFKRKNS